MSGSRSQFSAFGGGQPRREWCIGVGSVVSLSLDSQSLKGEVLAHDPSTRFIILKMPSSKCHSQWDIHMVNLNTVKEFRVIADGPSSSNNNIVGSSPNSSLLVTQSGLASLNGSLSKDYQPPPPLPSLNLQKLETRLKDSIEKKKRYLMGYKDGVSTEGQTLFRAISKTLDEVVWDGQNIIVMDMVTISPPYRPENVKGTRHMEAFNHVKKIVEKHVNDQQQALVISKKETGGGNSPPSGGVNTSTPHKKSPPSLSNGGSNNGSSSSGGGQR